MAAINVRDPRVARAVLMELERRRRAKNPPVFRDPNFPKQTAFQEDPARLKAAQCTRRAGKSYGLAVKLVSQKAQNLLVRIEPGMPEVFGVPVALSLPDRPYDGKDVGMYLMLVLLPPLRLDLDLLLARLVVIGLRDFLIRHGSPHF